MQVASSAASVRKVESDAARRQAQLLAPSSTPAVSLAVSHGVGLEHDSCADDVAVDIGRTGDPRCKVCTSLNVSDFCL